MRVLIHDYGGYPFCLELSREIAARGHSVQHVYFPAFSGSMQNMTARPHDPPGLEIVPLGADLPYTRYNSLMQRRSQEIAYGKRLSAHLRAWKPEIVVSANAPLDVARLTKSAVDRIGARFLFWQQDIISVAMAVILRQKLGVVGAAVAAYYRSIERRIARSSDDVVCISKDFLPVLSEWGVPPERCTVIENWAPKDDIRPQPKENAWARRHGLQDKKVLLYSGRLGLKHNPALLLRLAQEFRSQPDVVVLVVAEGQGAEWLAAQKQAAGLENLMLMPFQPYEDLPYLLATAEILVGIIEESADLYSVPSKILSYLAAGRAILAAMPSRNINAKHILRIGAGFVVPPDDADAMLAAAHTLLDDAQLRARCAQAARDYAESAFDIGRIADRFMPILARMAHNDRQGAHA